MKPSLIVCKFGGTSMGDISSMDRSATISLERNSSMVVVSATSGTTDKLIHIAKLASAGRGAVRGDANFLEKRLGHQKGAPRPKERGCHCDLYQRYSLPPLRRQTSAVSSVASLGHVCADNAASG